MGVNSLPPVTGTVSIAGTPTVNVANLPGATPARLWQGTPFFVDSNFSGPDQQGCRAFNTPPPGMVLFVERVSNTLILPPGGTGISRIELTPFGAPAGANPTSMFLPAEPGPPIMALGIKQEVYSGAVEVGVPATAMSVCQFSDGNGTINVIGYFVPAQ